MIKKPRAELTPPPTAALPAVPPAPPAKSAEPDLAATMMVLANAVQHTAQLVADSAAQQIAVLKQLAASKEPRPSGMEAVVKRDANGRMTRVLITLK